MDYRIDRENYKFTIRKISGITEEISVSLYLETSCGPSNRVPIISKTHNTEVEIDLDTIDRKYLNNLLRLEIQTIGTPNKVYLPYYPDLLKSVVESLEEVLCGCDCDDCTDCTPKDKILDASMKVLLFYTISNIDTNKSLNKGLTCISCELGVEVLCLLTKEKIYGKSFPTLFYKKILAMYYLVFYYSGRFGIKDENNRSYPEFKNFDKVLKCIKKLGLDTVCIDFNLNSIIGGIPSLPLPT